MKKAIIYQKEECVIIKTISISMKNFAFFVAVNRKKIIYLKENLYNGNTTYASLDKMINALNEYKSPAIFNTKILLDTFVNTVNYKISNGIITESDEILEMICQFEKIINDPYIRQMTSPNVTSIFNKQAMFEVTNTIKKIDGKVKKMSLSSLLSTNDEKSNDVFMSQNWLETDAVDNKELVYQSILNSNKKHRRSPIDFIFNNKVLNVYMIVMVVAVVTFASCLELITKWKSTGSSSEDTIDKIREEALIDDPTDNDDEIYDPNAIDPTKLSNDNSNKNSKSNTSSNNSKSNTSSYSKYGKVYTSYEGVSVLNVDFKKLLKQNSDTVGWIYINNTNVNYPIVQTVNNSFYLNHDFNKKSNVAGWIYLDYRADFTNFKKNTVIYGHGRTDKVMFGSLENTLKKSWYTNKNN